MDADQATIDWLKRSIHSVLDSLNWKYLAEEDVGAREVVCIFGAGDMGNWVLISRILPQKGVVLIMATCQENVPDGRQRQAAVEFVTRANFGILNGFFDMDLTDGDLRFSSRVEYGLMDRNTRQFEANFRQTFQIVHGTFSKYLPGVVGVTKRGMTGKAAVELVEGGANTLPDPQQSPLLTCVARYLAASGTNYVSHPEKSIIRMPCTVAGVTFHLRIKAMEDTHHLYVFCNYPRHAGKVPLAAIPLVSEYICRANWALPFGYFDMDVADGELRFVTWLPTADIPLQVVQTQFVRSLIVSSISTLHGPPSGFASAHCRAATFTKYLPGLEDLVNGTCLLPEVAIERVEADRQSDAGPLHGSALANIIDASQTSSDEEDDRRGASARAGVKRSARLAKDEPLVDDDTGNDPYRTGAPPKCKCCSARDLRANSHRTPVSVFPVHLRFSPDGSGMGALEFIGSRGGSTVWQNPGRATRQTCTHSELT